jgi:hypothetical protein
MFHTTKGTPLIILAQAGKRMAFYGLEVEVHYNNRENHCMFRDAMLKLLLAETLPYAKLIADLRCGKDPFCVQLSDELRG